MLPMRLLQRMSKRNGSSCLFFRMMPALRLTTLLLEVCKPVLAKLYCADKLPDPNSANGGGGGTAAGLIKDFALRPLE